MHPCVTVFLGWGKENLTGSKEWGKIFLRAHNIFSSVPTPVINNDRSLELFLLKRSAVHMREMIWYFENGE